VTVQAQLEEVRRLTEYLASGEPTRHGAIPWASPVPVFGMLARAQVATLGLNPSNLEFVNRYGEQLDDEERRFHSLSSLGLDHWALARPKDIQNVWKYCEDYFQRSPYDGWFRPLNRILSGLGVSYYDKSQPACHLDLVPYATSDKWSALTKNQRQGLGTIGTASLIQLLCASNVRVLILNGMSVVREFSNVLGMPLVPQEIPNWTLSNSKGGVRGYAYELCISGIQGRSLGRDMIVLGYNHNIQSSFGVTNKVISEIAKWISTKAGGIAL
jgi:hypothetical protein